MKKLICLTLTMVLLVSAAACSAAHAPTRAPSAGNYASSPTPAPMAPEYTPALEAPAEYAPSDAYDGADYTYNYEPDYDYDYGYDGEQYAPITETGFVSPLNQPLSTFSADVDTAAYSNIRRMIANREYIPYDAVRIEEMINYFQYDYPAPTGEDPVSVTTELTDCPWYPGHNLLSVGLRAKDIQKTAVASNLVFLIDVSGSMDEPNKLPLVKRSFALLVRELTANDRISIITYASSDEIVMSGESGANKANIMRAINDLYAGGSTNGSAGITTAYELAQKYFIKNGNNRIILATDGDFNVGVTSEDELARLISSKRQTGVYLSALGYGMGNYKDTTMEALANNGNGNYAYIDNVSEARKALVKEMGGTMFTVAKDVKLQVEFNPAKVQGYRLIGYEHDMLAAQDFLNDAKDAGEMGAGHTMTALYEIIPAGSGDVPALKYQSNSHASSNEWMTVKIRYKNPNSSVSKEINKPVSSGQQTSDNTRLASAVAEFGMILRGSQYRGSADLQSLLNRVSPLARRDDSGYIKEFQSIVNAYIKNY